ncbi:amino acid synthesis family protein [Hypericibacter sp.]|uniref:amino acid synthesis family protein n=1 Tax=Hypericibacter sp. TaxID=2705401 RepID=UPI003D6CED77
MELRIRKIVTFAEQVMFEGEKEADPILRVFGVAAVVRNPWAGRGYVEDLKPEIKAFAPKLGKLLTDQIVALAGGADQIEAYGKAAMSGLDCEIEHASALIHTLRFGNYYREALKAKSYLGFTNTRGPANTQINIPLMDRHDTGRRSHYLTVQFSIYDAPADDELIAAFGGASGGRPHHRIGDRYQDLKDIGADIDNPAGL